MRIARLCDEARASEGPVSTQILFERDTGTHWLELDAQPDGDTVTIYFTDLSPLGEAASDYLELESLFNVSLDVLCVASLDGYFTRINPMLVDLLGFSEDRLLSTPISEFVHPDDRRKLAEVQIALQSTETCGQELEIRCVCSDGSVRWISWNGVRHGIRVFGAARDITQRKRVEQELERQQERFALAITASSCGIWDWNIDTGEVWRSPRIAELLGYEPGELPALYEGWELRLHPLDHGPTHHALHQHLDHGAVYDVEYRLRMKSGAYRWLRSRGEAIRDHSGRPRRMTGTISDIDAQKRIELDLARAKAEAEAANLAKSRFLANMSHEIRTPMTAILGYSDLLNDPAIDEQERCEHIATIRRNGDHLLTLINDILDLSKIEADRIEVEAVEVSVVSIICEMMSTMRVRAKTKGIELEVKFATAIPDRIYTDPVRLRQILVNLIGNAIKFTATGSVRIVLAHDQRPSESSLLQFRVEDTGVGMTREQMSRLFQPFSQADSSTTRKHGGTGLGLTISQRLAKLLGGEIRVTSSAGRGSTFDLYLPVSPVDGVAFVDECIYTADPQSTQTVDAKTSLDGRILLAEDGLDNQRLIGRILRKAGLEVDVVDNGALACERIADRTSPHFDLILMDMQMPVLDGYSATRQLRDSGCDLPIIALTAHAMSGDRTKCFDAGCTEFATKPVNRRALLELITRFLPGEPRG